MSNAKIVSFIQQWRLYLVLFVMFLCVVAIGWKVSALHIIDRDFLQSQGDARTIRTVPLVANRGVITDRNGEPLAVSSPVKSIWVNPQEIGNKPSQIQRLATELQLDVTSLQEAIVRNARREFLYVKRRLAPAEAERV